MNKTIFVMVTVLSGYLLCSCGSSASSASPSSDVSSSSETIVTSEIQSNDSYSESTSKSDEVIEEVIEEAMQEVDDTSKKFEIEKYYEIDPRVLNTALEDGVYIQIGDSVLELGKVTLRDFYEVGIDLYEPGTYEIRDESYNTYMLEEDVENGGIVLGSIGEDIAFKFLVRTKGIPVGTKLGDLIVDDVTVSDGHLYMNGGPWTNGYNDYAADYINSGSAKDLHFIYSNGGVRFTGSSTEIKEDFGYSSGEVSYDDRGYLAVFNKYVYPQKIPNYNASIQYFSNDKCLWMEIWAHEPR